MSSRNGHCRCYENSGSNSSSVDFDPHCGSINPWYCRLAKPLTFAIVTTMLAISAGHLWSEYSASDSFWIIKSDLTKLTNQLRTLSMEVKNIMESRDELRGKLREVGCVIPKMSETIVRLREEVSEEIGAHTEVVMKAFSADKMRKMVRSELEMYDADKTGRTDYALESLGGSIVSTRNTRDYTAGAPVLSFMGIIPLCRQRNTPRTVIQAGSIPGECWAFEGSIGSVAIRLIARIYVTGITIEHISSSISPDGEATAAPKDFSVWGLDHVDDNDGFLYGEFTYDNRASSPVQYFPVEYQPAGPYEIIEIRIHSNSGNPKYTCIYRIRVHGSLAEAEAAEATTSNVPLPSPLSSRS